MCAIPERLRGVFTTRRCTNPRLPLHYLCHVKVVVIPARKVSLSLQDVDDIEIPSYVAR